MLSQIGPLKICGGKWVRRYTLTRFGYSRALNRMLNMVADRREDDGSCQRDKKADQSVCERAPLMKGVPFCHKRNLTDFITKRW